MNNIPYYYDDIWKKHEIDYFEFHGYKFIKDLSYTKDKSKSIILLFNYNDNNILRGYGDGIIFPQLNYFNIENVHIKKKDKKIQDVLNYILNIFQEYNIVDTKIYDNLYLCKSMGYSIFNLIDLKDFKLKSRLDMYFESIKDDNIETEMEGGGTRTIINRYNKNKPEFKIYFGEIEDNIFNSFVNKHLELAGKKTKSDECWNLIKEMIQDKKALLLVSNNNYVLYFISNSYCYYSINACTKRDKIVTFLLYEGIKWLISNNYNFIHFGSFYKYYDDEKNINICKFKKSFCNKMYTQYYLEKI